MKVPLLDLKPQYAQIKDQVVPELLSQYKNLSVICVHEPPNNVSGLVES